MSDGPDDVPATGSVSNRHATTDSDTVVVTLPYDLVFSTGQVRHVPSQRELCKKAASIAEAHNLPVPFFANLIWQESGFRSDVVSSAGAQGIAQFMPETAAEYGLHDPFDPIPALAASGKLLSDLRQQFGNLGLAAAAYNAGPKRVEDWMKRRARLPGETRHYVKIITGRPAEQWVRTDAEGSDKIMPQHAPCLEVALALESQAKAQRSQQAELGQPVSIESAKRAVSEIRVSGLRASRTWVSHRRGSQRTRRVAGVSQSGAEVTKRLAGVSRSVARTTVAAPRVFSRKAGRHYARRSRHPAQTATQQASTRKVVVVQRVRKPLVGRSHRVKLATTR